MDAMGDWGFYFLSKGGLGGGGEGDGLCLCLLGFGVRFDFSKHDIENNIDNNL